MSQIELNRDQIYDIINSIESLDFIRYGRNTNDHDEIIRILENVVKVE